jgi:hypothetical protein
MEMTLQDQAATTKTTAGDGKDEVELSYFGNISPITLGFNDPLGWRKVSFAFLPRIRCSVLSKQNEGTLKYMTHVVQDILAIPGVSVSVEHLFSSVKHTLSDAGSSMTAETMSVDVVTKEWLNSGLGQGVNYMDFIKIHDD